jgi:hypothetical protein
MLRLDQVISERVIDSPYPHIALKDSLDSIADLNENFPAQTEFGASIRMEGDLTAGDTGYEELVLRSSAYSVLHRQVYSENFIKVFL